MIEIIPAIDIIEGKCVRLTKGDYNRKKIYNENPLEVAKMFEAEGIKRLHLVDLDGAKAKHIVNYCILERIASHTGLQIDFGGGIKSDNDVRIAFESGANQITGGSIAVKDKTLFLKWLNHYGDEKIILGADVKDEKIAVSGWQEKTSIALMDFLKEYAAEGVKYVICTDISKDGVLEGSSVDLYQNIRNELPEIKLIASGGVTSVQEIETLAQKGLYGVIIGKALYENKITLTDLQRFYL